MPKKRNKRKQVNRNKKSQSKVVDQTEISRRDFLIKLGLIAGGGAAITTGIYFGLKKEELPQSKDQPYNNKDSNMFKPETRPSKLEDIINPENITFEQARIHPELRQFYLNNIFTKKDELDDMFQDIGSLSYKLKDKTEEDNTYNLTKEEIAKFSPLASTRVVAPGIKPDVTVYDRGFRFCKSEDEFLSLLDNEAYTCATHMGNARIERRDGGPTEKIPFEGLDKETIALIHEALSSKYQVQNIKRKIRKVRPEFEHFAQDTYTFIAYKLVQKAIQETDPNNRKTLNKWFNVFSPDIPYDEKLAKELGVYEIVRPKE